MLGTLSVQMKCNESILLYKAYFTIYDSQTFKCLVQSWVKVLPVSIVNICFTAYFSFKSNSKNSLIPVLLIAVIILLFSYRSLKIMKCFFP